MGENGGEEVGSITSFTGSSLYAGLPYAVQGRSRNLFVLVRVKGNELILQLERDRWIWAINAEMERQVRENVAVEEAHRDCGNVP